MTVGQGLARLEQGLDLGLGAVGQVPLGQLRDHAIAGAFPGPRRACGLEGDESRVREYEGPAKFVPFVWRAYRGMALRTLSPVALTLGDQGLRAPWICPTPWHRRPRDASPDF